MKIALIIERMDIQLGGAERSISEVAKALTEQGMDVTLLAAKGQAPDTHGFVLCETSGKRTSHTIFSNALKTHLETHTYDIVHSVLPFDFADIYQPRGGSYSETIVQNAASYENPIVSTYKRLTSFTNQRRQQWLNAEQNLSQGQEGPIIAALSGYVVNQFKQHYNTPDDRIRLIANGVNTHRPVDADTVDQFKQTVLSQLKIAENPSILFLFGAHNFRLKGLKPLIKALAQTKSQNSVLLIAGNGPQTPYQALAEQLNVQQRILFLGASTDIPTALTACDAAVLPTFYDPASRFILEALALRKPVITTQFNGASDLFQDSRHGQIIDTPTNIPALTNALDQLTENTTRVAMAKAIEQDRIPEKVSIERVAQELITLYTSILPGLQ